jgi:replication factor C large subunit
VVYRVNHHSYQVTIVREFPAETNGGMPMFQREVGAKWRLASIHERVDRSPNNVESFALSSFNGKYLKRIIVRAIFVTLFTIKYAPKNSAEIVGQEKAVAELRDFIVHYNTKKQKALLLYGPIGTGKTSSVYALAHELGYDLLEINSSHLRNEERMKSFLGSALGQQSLFMTPKLILIDEIDLISGVYDRGCIPALVKSIERSPFPVILTANDPFDQKFKALRKQVLMVEFPKVHHTAIAQLLQRISAQEGITYEEKALNSLARQADGDLRSALIDLHVCSTWGKCTFENVISLSERNRIDSIISALTIIFKSSTVDNALTALDDVDMDVNDVVFWLDNNLPYEYRDARSLAKAYEYLARADVFSGRIRKRQHWRFLVYINNLLTAGISSAKEQKNPHFVSYKPTMRFLRMWQAKMKIAKKKDIAAKLAERTHTSQQNALQQIPYLQQIFKYGGGTAIAEELELSDDESEWLRKT